MIEFLVDYGWLLAGMLAAGCVTGFAAGLFGIGGGVVTVPVLYAVFQALGVSETVSLKTAIGTSLAVIIITSIRSLTAHHKAGHVDREIVIGWGVWIAIGSALGGVIVRWAPVETLTLIFCFGTCYVAWQRFRAKGDGARKQVNLHAKRLKIPVSIGSGVFCALMGLGGGAIGVMVMTLAGRSMHQAIGTSAGFGIAVAVPGALGFVLSGWETGGLPLASIGYVNLPAFAAMALTAGLIAPIGARVAHSLAPQLLSRIFAVYVLIAGAGLAIDVFV